MIKKWDANDRKLASQYIKKKIFKYKSIVRK